MLVVVQQGQYAHYFLQKLSPTEQRYSTFDRELLAVYCAIHHFLEAHEFHVFTLGNEPVVEVHQAHECSQLTQGARLRIIFDHLHLI